MPMTTLFINQEKIAERLNDLEMDFMILHKWFHENPWQMSLYCERWRILPFPQNKFE